MNSKIRDFDETESCKVLTHTAFGNKEKNYLKEDGLLEVVLTSRKEIAKPFKKWVK